MSPAADTTAFLTRVVRGIFTSLRTVAFKLVRFDESRQGRIGMVDPMLAAAPGGDGMAARAY
jgi:hypothetical protein